MKIILSKHYLLIAFFAGTVGIIAQSVPTPTPVIPPPGLPIDEGLIALLIGGILFGTYTISRYNKKRKPLN